MDRAALEKLLRELADGKTEVAVALDRLRRFPEESLGYATLDTHRALRQGHPEVVFGESKTAPQIAGIVDALTAHGHPILVTRVAPEKAAEVAALTQVTHHPEARALTRNADRVAAKAGAAWVAVISAGTSDQPVAEEAMLTLAMLGVTAERHYDIGVAGLHRLLNRLPRLREAAVVIIVAGMEGALPSVAGGLLERPIIAVPTSVGYGVAAGGFTALAGMLSSCASGVTVVNIDNGFGAAYAAYRILGAHGLTH